MSSKNTHLEARAMSIRHFQLPEANSQYMAYFVERRSSTGLMIGRVMHKMFFSSLPLGFMLPNLGTPSACMDGMLSNAVKQPTHYV